MNYLLDLALIAIVVISVMIAKKRGFIKSSDTIISLIISALLIVTLLEPFTSFLVKSPLGKTISDKISFRIEQKADDEFVIEDEQSAKDFGIDLGLPVFMTNMVGDKIEDIDNMKDDIITAMSEAVTEAVLKVVAIIVLFILVKIGVFFLIKLLDVAFKLPLLNDINKILGIVVGAINGVLAVYMLCAALALFAPSESMDTLKVAIDNSILVKYFYNNNLLIDLFI